MDEEKLKLIATFFSKASKALLVDLLQEEFQEQPTFYQKNYVKYPLNWSQPAAISIMVAAILCESEGIEISSTLTKDADKFAKFQHFVSSNEALGQTQADGQWRYYAKIITEFCGIFDLTKDTFSNKNTLFEGYNLLEYLNSIPPENE